MKLEINPLSILKEKRKEKVNSNFAALYSGNAHKHAAHARKREIAIQVLNGSCAPHAFKEEAILRGMTEESFARMIMSKDSELDKAELLRQKIHARIDAANTIEELEKVGEIDA